MKKTATLLFLTLFFFATGQAQSSRNNNRSFNFYGGSYQRVASVENSNSTFEIRGEALWAWGDNAEGQLGDGTNTNKNIPTQIGNDTRSVSISAGETHVSGLKSDGTLWSWGGK